MALAAVLLDVGGTLWPETWREDDERPGRMDAVLAGSSALFPLLHEAVKARDDADAAVLEVLLGQGIAADPVLARALRKATCSRFVSIAGPLPGAIELLAAIRRLELRCVIVSNVSFRDAASYRRDFVDLGWGELIDECVTSIDVGCRKPGAAIFDAAVAAAGVPPGACVMIGDAETKDIAPARARGIRAIRVGDLTSATVADAVVGGPADCVPILTAWAAEPG